jgi:hypothetical protein
MKPSANTVFIILSICVVAIGVIWYFSDSGTEAPLTTETTKNEAQLQFQTLVTQLQPISFDTSILTDEHFLALQDITTQIVPETSGRLDPFAPVAGVSAP